ncbi:MAG TPA: rhodanese-like domain-containing protein [Blastocatellia bacterium]
MKEISAKEAYDLLANDPDCIYLDVRSIPEFETGHPERAVNVPLMHFNPQFGMSPNDDFAPVVAANLSKDAKIIVGCKTGGRSARACDIMTSLGFSDVTNMRGGFGGVMDNFGQVREPGWSTLGLPLCTECKDSDRYDTLAPKAK